MHTTGDTAKQLSERFGRILQDRASFSVNSTDTSISHSRQLESAIPPSKISALSAGEFVGMVADDALQKIDFKAFHCSIINDHEALKKEQQHYHEIPVIHKLDHAVVQHNYLQIKQDIQDIIHSEMERLLNNPALKHLIIQKG